MSIKDHDRVGFSFNNVTESHAAFGITFRRFDQYTPELILSALQIVLQSNSNFLADDTLSVKVDLVRIPTGGMRVMNIGKTKDRYYSIHRRSIYSPKISPEDGQICLAVAIVIGKSLVDNNINEYNKLIYPPNHSDLITEGYRLCLMANVDLNRGGGHDEIVQFQEYLKNEYNLTVYASRDGATVYFKSPYSNKKVISLLLDNNHYSVIKSLTAAFACSYFCAYCAQPYTQRHLHTKCVFRCNHCFEQPPCEHAIEMHCSECNRTFINPKCFQNHIDKKICLNVRICTKCLIRHKYDKKNPHVCGIKYCSICKKMTPIRHECYIPTIEVKEIKEKQLLFVFYDFETTQSTPLHGDIGKIQHNVNFCVTQHVCGLCSHLDEIELGCGNCGTRMQIFGEGDIVNSFMHYLGEIEDKFNQIFVIAHNSQKFDGHWVLRHMYTHKDEWCLTEDSLIMNGTKILQIKVGRYRFIDSLNFFSVPLAKLPKMFNLNTDSKGYYPHYFNVESNMFYSGELPDIKYYDPDSMKASDREKFLIWYDDEKRKGTIFNNRIEIESYCKQDVTILRLACLKFRSMMIELTKVDPFSKVTVASTCMAVYKTNFLRENQIAILPPNGYRLRDRQSVKALKWIEWVAHFYKIKLESASNGREVRIADNILVDAMHIESRTVFQFHGCYWHMCKKCYPFQSHSLPSDKQMRLSTLYDNTIARSDKIKALGFKLIEIWEHEFDKMLIDNPRISEYLSTLEHLKVDPIVPHDAFFGGRTGLCSLYYKCDNGEKIHYSDVTSLYPYVNKYFEYPIGVPVVLIGDDLIGRDVFNINGLIKSHITPPKNLYHPVLPIKMNGYLMFVLCYECGMVRNTSECTHDDDARSFVGTYVSNELRIAVENGYTINKIYEAWDYKIEKYDPVQKTGGLFAEYVNTFLKIKTEASGYPSWVKTETDKDNFISFFNEKKGILLNKVNIEKNEGMRSLAKIMLNSHWGRFALKSNKIRKRFIDKKNALLDLITDPSAEVHSFFPLSDTAILTSYAFIDEAVPKQSDVNIVLAAYTTAHARIHLYKYLDRLGERVLYYDTDSVIYTQKIDEDVLELGDLLGELTDELANYGTGSFISEAVFSSEKSYAFRVETPSQEAQQVCKVKGIKLTYKNAAKINFDTLKRMVLSSHLENEDNKVFLNDRMILRTADSYIYSCNKIYTFKINAKKRRRVGYDKIRTLPYGWSAN